MPHVPRTYTLYHTLSMKHTEACMCIHVCVYMPHTHTCLTYMPHIPRTYTPTYKDTLNKRYFGMYMRYVRHVSDVSHQISYTLIYMPVYEVYEACM